MKLVRLTRRHFLALGAAACGVSAARGAPQSPGTDPTSAGHPTIRSLSRFSDGLWCFDPLGLWVKPGETVRFIGTRIGITTLTAYHPDNDNHELRIPEGAAPFDVGYPERVFFDLTLSVPGTYDYFSRYQEILGMVGRIVVGEPGGPGERPWGYGGSQGRRPVYEGVLRTARLLDSGEITRRQAVPFPFDELMPPYPLWD